MLSRTRPQILICEQLDSVGLELLKNHADVTVNLNIDNKTLKSIVGEYDALIIGPETQVKEDILEAGNDLRVIGTTSSTVENIDVSTATSKGIRIVSAAEINVVSIAELVLGLMLMLARKLPEATQRQANHVGGIRLAGKTLGLVGFDPIARQVATVAHAFGMHIIVSTKLANVEINQLPHIQPVEFHKLLQESDFVSLHENIKSSSECLIGAKEMSMMRPTAYLLNCSSESLINATAAIEQLDGGYFAGIGMDVPTRLSESMEQLVNHAKVVATPAIGSKTEEAQQEISNEVAAQIIDILEHNEPSSLLPLAVVPLEKIMPHESIDQKRVDRLKNRLENMGRLANPPIVTPLEDRYMVLDGATRTAALKQLGYPHAVVQITTEEEGLGLHTWYHVIQKITEGDLKKLLEELPDITLEAVQPDQAADRMFEYGALCYVHFGNGDAYLIQPRVGVNRLDALNMLTETYIEASFVDRTLESDLARLKSEYNDLTALVVFPEYTVGQVMQVTLSGRYFPAGITRFLIPGRILRVNAELEILKSKSMSLSEKNRWLRRHLEEKVQGNHVRFYSESIYLLDE